MPKRKRRRRRSKRRIRNPLRGIDPLTYKRAGLGAAWVFLAGAVIAGWVLGVPRLEAYTSQHQQADDVEVRFVNAPAWMKGDLEAMLVLTAAGHIGANPLRRDDLLAARDALQMTGWFDHIGQVRRVNAGLVEIDARFAEPFAVIRDGDGDHLVDSHGRLMPRTFPLGGAQKFIAIVGAHFDRPARPGQHWEGADVTAALRVLRLIRSRPWHMQVAEIDLARYMADSSIRLVTDRGCTIVWGRAPGEEGASEVPAQRKLSYLDYHHEQYGHIDRGFARELDITGDVVIGR